jgi:hypothetical protein
VTEHGWYAGAYWGPRAASVIGAAERLHGCLAALADVHSMFSDWQDTGMSPRRRPSIGTDVEPLTAWMHHQTRARDADDAGRSGFVVGMWNGDLDRAVGLTLSAGWHVGPHAGNACTLQLPPDPASHLTAEQARSVVQALVESWDPSWATLSSHSWRDQQGWGPGRPVAGWLTWVLDRRAPRPLPAGSLVERVAGGCLLTAGATPDDQARDRAVALAPHLRTVDPRRRPRRRRN